MSNNLNIIPAIYALYRKLCFETREMVPRGQVIALVHPGTWNDDLDRNYAAIRCGKNGYGWEIDGFTIIDHPAIPEGEVTLTRIVETGKLPWQVRP